MTQQNEFAERDAKVLAPYHELLYAVARKFPGESRHQTALRYIQEAESCKDNRAQSAASRLEGDA